MSCYQLELKQFTHSLFFKISAFNFNSIEARARLQSFCCLGSCHAYYLQLSRIFNMLYCVRPGIEADKALALIFYDSLVTLAWLSLSVVCQTAKQNGEMLNSDGRQTRHMRNFGFVAAHASRMHIKFAAAFKSICTCHFAVYIIIENVWEKKAREKKRMIIATPNSLSY